MNPGLFFVALAAALGAGAATTIVQSGHAAPRGTTFAIPDSIRIEHEELHGDLAAAAKTPGRTGAAAGRVAALLHPHFVSEEEFALPPLGLLQSLANGATAPEMRDAIALAERLKAELPGMLREHKAIVAALDELRRAAGSEGHEDVIHFAEKLTVHAKHEEQVLYPAAILVGEYLKLKLPR